MELSFFPLTLEAIDQAAAESLCLFIGADERPLTGLAGLADWRLSGRLSRLLRAGALTGDAGEAVLTPPGTRLGFRKLFVFGLGPAGQDETALAQRLSEGLRKVAHAGVQEAALQLPARLSPEAGMRALLADTGEPQGLARTMIFGSEPQKLMAALSQAARGQAQVERRVVKVQVPATRPKETPRTPPVAPAVALPALVATVPEAELPIAPPIAASESDPPRSADPAPAAHSNGSVAPGKRPAPPPPPPPPAGKSRPPPTAPQRYVPQEPTQNVFDKTKRKKP